MNKLVTTAATLAIAVSSLAAPAMAQGGGAPQGVAVVDVQRLATGYRASKITGATVVNQAGEKVGTVDDLLVTPNDRVPFAVISVGGFLGMGNKLVVVPYQALDITPEKIQLANATKDQLKAMPEFKYAK